LSTAETAAASAKAQPLPQRPSRVM
jgi:hypothetical protein